MADDLQTNLSTYKLQLQQVYFCRFSNDWKSGVQLVAKPHSIQGLNPGRFGLFWGWVVSALVVGSFLGESIRSYVVSAKVYENSSG